MPTTAANPQSQPWRTWYGLQRWMARARHQLHIEPLCAACLERGRITPATVADHHPPHHGDWNAFVLGPLQSLCADFTRANGPTTRAAIAATSATTACRPMRATRSTLERLRGSADPRPISKTKRVTPTTINAEPTAPQTLVMFGSWNTCRTNSDMAVMKMPFITQSVADHCVSQLRH